MNPKRSILLDPKPTLNRSKHLFHLPRLAAMNLETSLDFPKLPLKKKCCFQMLHIYRKLTVTILLTWNGGNDAFEIRLWKLVGPPIDIMAYRFTVHSWRLMIIFPLLYTGFRDVPKQTPNFYIIQTKTQPKGVSGKQCWKLSPWTAGPWIIEIENYIKQCNEIESMKPPFLTTHQWNIFNPLPGPLNWQGAKSVEWGLIKGNQWYMSP